MFWRKIFVNAIAAALILPAVIGCLIAADAQSMPCCAQTTCPRHQGQACASTIAPADRLQSGPEPRASLVASCVVADLYVRVDVPTAATFSSAAIANTPDYSPPELYTLHSALLI